MAFCAATTTKSSLDRFNRPPLHVDRPAKLRQLLLDVGERVGKCTAPNRAGGVLGEDAVALKNESLSFPRAFGFASVGDCFVLPGRGGLQWTLFNRMCC